MLRTPLKVVVVDHRRGRHLPRTVVDLRVAAIEGAILAVLAAGALAWGELGFWLPGLVAVPLIGVEAWFGMRSRGRRLVPELAGAVVVATATGVLATAPA